ncbi:homoserine dehydrogenase [Brockia lithotrophica]|uniref:Homoserine dehydrogenase n=1 Tax=Brockia lithotrophica TaxID=933949 RepID=A0A660KTH5_9BACL|nr:homoserine dehydrogenase [Brockia lithotrophica]RKQ83856.1 homoserine dehydrogenase [Brockia lithotrophica]
MAFGEGQTVRIGLLGLGTVGTGVVRILTQHAEELRERTGVRFEVTRILVQDPTKERPVKVPTARYTVRGEEVVLADDVDVVVEVMGGIEPTRALIEAALRARKPVITANKDLLALHGLGLHALAEENGVDLFYEASVGGGIPLLRTVIEGFASDRITHTYGIVNGTTNYILSKMDREGVDFSEALREAQELGYAEADPTNDVDGLDAAYKMVILSRLAFHAPVRLTDVRVAGIRSVTREDLLRARDFGYTVKLIGWAARKDGRIEIGVAPTWVKRDHPLAHVHGSFNAVYVHGEAVGETMFYGRGAGDLPTAMAVVSDLVAAVKNALLGVSGRGHIRLRQSVEVVPPEEAFVFPYAFRLTTDDVPGVLSELTAVVARHGLSISRMLQIPNTHTAEITFLTHRAPLSAVEKAREEFASLPFVREVHTLFRVLS